ncbi:helix-turn-helix domain-containing protein [Cytobacillus oceanisediminis]|uniref:helix-turn-helix domain-containing protein n=1 Tax=Cytobacillus oceanisediminis TaxID=665099 RepID=UPI00254C83D7|nr:helix-turn-helix domain-containing protein [Cytobacillus oceanisediminis]MDK7669538.1 helix-turn-helix domain-containing protein [Cytobacillus oceanisediminis]
MKRIDIVASEAAFETLGTFETIEQLNETVRNHKESHALNKTELAVLDLLHRYSAKYKGVSFLCKNTIGKLVGKSRRTIIRVCQRLEELGIIRQYAMKRASDMQQTSNAIVILPVPQEAEAKISNVGENEAPVTQEPAENVTPIKPLPLKTNNVINNTYQAFKNTVGYFVNDQKLTNKLYGIYLAQISYIRHCYESSELIDCGIEALITAFQATKRKPIRNMAGYYHGVLDRVLDRLYLTSVR